MHRARPALLLSRTVRAGEQRSGGRTVRSADLDRAIPSRRGPVHGADVRPLPDHPSGPAELLPHHDSEEPWLKWACPIQAAAIGSSVRGNGGAHGGGRASRLGRPLRAPAALPEPAAAGRVPADRGPGWLIAGSTRTRIGGPDSAAPVPAPKRPQPEYQTADQHHGHKDDPDRFQRHPATPWPDGHCWVGIVSRRPGGATEHAVVVLWIRQGRAATRWPAASLDGGAVVRPGSSRARASCWLARPGEISPGTSSTARTWTSPNQERPRPSGVMRGRPPRPFNRRRPPRAHRARAHGSPPPLG
jgi:hypothetical protein